MLQIDTFRQHQRQRRERVIGKESQIEEAIQYKSRSEPRFKDAYVIVTHTRNDNDNDDDDNDSTFHVTISS